MVIQSLMTLLREQVKLELQVPEGTRRREKMEQRHKKEAEKIGLRLEAAEKAKNPNKRISMVEKTINKKVSNLLLQQEKEKDKQELSKRKHWEKRLHRERTKWKKEILLEEQRRQGLRPHAIVQRSVHNEQAIHYFIENKTVSGPSRFLEFCKPEVARVQKIRIANKSNLKLQVVFARFNPDGTETTEEKYLGTHAVAIRTEEDVPEAWEYFYDEIMRKLENVLIEKTGWRLKRIIGLHVSVYHYDPMSGSSWVPLPKRLANRKAIINLKNNDVYCLKWAITRAFHPKDNHPERIDKDLIQQSKKYNWKKMEFPSTLKDIKIFERNNPNIGLIVYTEDEKTQDIVPLWLTPKQDPEKLAILFVYKNHYMLVKNESALMAKQLGSKDAVHFCRRCLLHFKNQARLENHTKYCQNHDYMKITYPIPEEKLKFKN